MSETAHGLCINCDNRHGCRTGDPLCFELELGPSERTLPGREVMLRRGLLRRCRRCGHFRQCWTEDAYSRSLLR